MSPEFGGGCEPTRKAEVTSEKSAGFNGSTTGDARLALLLSFLSPACKITHEFLLRGGSSRKRWTISGGVEEVDATTAGLAPELAGLLSDTPKLINALNSLAPAMLKQQDQGYTLDIDAVKSIHQDLSAEALVFWKTQALIVSFRAIPWKHIESSNLDRSSVLPHLQYTAQTYGGCLGGLNPTTRADFILTLLEASRFPTMVWKRSMVSLAEVAMRHVTSGNADHWYLSLRLSLAKSLLDRLRGDLEAAVSEIDNLITQQQQHTPRDSRENAAMGHLTLQRALNCMQSDDLTQAEQILDRWRHLGDKPSLMEQVVYFRRGITQGRILRSLGRFSEAHTHLNGSYNLASQLHGLIFDEDRRDLINELADTLLELERPYDAEAYLRVEFARRSKGMQDPAKSGKSLLEASLAEVLFAQGRTEEAERVCAGAEARWDELMKLGKFRILIVRAKIHHTRSEHADALWYWDEAMRQVSKFPETTGRTARVVALSRHKIVQYLGLTDTPDFERYTDPSTVLGKPGGTVYWIAGMRHWEDYLRSEAARTWM